jgi:hypothetical protein
MSWDILGYLTFVMVFIDLNWEHVITLEVSRWIANTEIGLVIFFTQTSLTTMGVPPSAPGNI